ncbi:MCE family protein [Pseudoxanthomonas sp. SGD-10]|nr:MCE family protein [Pseudoxanthomonas sp. SGD-10]
MEETEKRKGITVGIFIFVGIVIFLLGVFTLGGQKKTFVKSFELNVVFDDIQGLKTGNNVWFSGVKIGTIKKIQFYGTSQVQVFLNIDESAHKYIHKDAKASISSDGLIGNKIVVIDGGSPKFPFVEDGDQLQVNKTLSTDDIMKTLQTNNRNLVDITTDFKILARNIVEGKGTVGSLMTDDQVAQNFKEIVSNLQKTTASANKMAAELNEFSGRLNNENGLVNKMLTDTIIYQKIQKSVDEFYQMSESAAAVTENLNKASSQLNESDNALGVLLNDEATAVQLKSAIGNLEASTQKLDENLKALQSNFLFRGYFRKKAKEESK